MTSKSEGASKSADKKAGRDAFQALFEFGYSDATGRVERGQVFYLEGLPNDERLVRLRYVAPVQVGTVLRECGECGKLFISDETREAHGQLWHGYECDGCGWVPRRDHGDREAALRRHRFKCDRVLAEKEARRAAHLEQIATEKLAAVA